MNNTARLIASLVLAVNIMGASYLSDPGTFTCVKYEKGVTQAALESCEETVQEVTNVVTLNSIAHIFNFSLTSMNLSSLCVLLFGERPRVEKRIFSDKDAPVLLKVCSRLWEMPRDSELSIFNSRFIHNSILPAIQMS